MSCIGGVSCSHIVAHTDRSLASASAEGCTILGACLDLVLLLLQPGRAPPAARHIAAVQPMWEQLSYEQRLQLLTVNVELLEQAAKAQGQECKGMS